jgi:adenylate cyclase, class 2
MREVEVKFLEVNVDEIVNILQSLGAKKIFEGEVIPSFFDYPDHRLKNEKKLLRLRKKGELVELTFKHKHEKTTAKIADETEVMVTDFYKMKKILEHIGLVEVKRRPKMRTSYQLGDYHYEFDTYEGLPTFLEIEAKNMHDLHAAVEAIGLSMKEAKAWSGRQVLDHYKRK